MTALNLANQWLNFIAPAAFVALLLVWVSRAAPRFFASKRAAALSPIAQAAIVFIANLLLLLLGLVVFGRDGKMASYALMVLGAATCQWVLLRGWRR